VRKHGWSGGGGGGGGADGTNSRLRLPLAPVGTPQASCGGSSARPTNHPSPFVALQQEQFKVQQELFI